MSADLVREILLATDFSPHAEQAAVAAAELANRFGARLHVLHVVGRARQQPAARAKLDLSLRGLPFPGAVLPSVTIGAADREIVRYAASHDIDLIVMGAHGRSGLARIAHGSVTDKVLRSAPCQVLAVKIHVPAKQPSATAAPVAAPRAPRCFVCARESGDSICGDCRARIQGEAMERRRHELQPHP